MLHKVVSRKILMDIEGSDALEGYQTVRKLWKRERGGTCLILGLVLIYPIDYNGKAI